MMRVLEKRTEKRDRKVIWFILEQEKAKGTAYCCFHLPNWRVQNKNPFKGAQ